MTSNGHLWSSKETAEYLGLSPSTVRGMARRGELPAYAVRRGLGSIRTRCIFRFRKEELEKWLKTRRVRMPSISG